MSTPVQDDIPMPVLISKDDPNINWDTSIMLVSKPDDEMGYVVPKESKRHSAFLNDLLAEGAPGVDGPCIVPINSLHTTSVRAVAWYMFAFADPGKEPLAEELPKPFPHPSIGPHVTVFEATYAERLFPKVGDKNLKPIIGIMHAANFLQIKALLILASVGLTFHLRGKTPSEIKELMLGQEPERAP